jgi:hypothetical protein
MEIECGSENKHNERLEVITEGSKYSFEKVHKFNYLGVTITDNKKTRKYKKESQRGRRVWEDCYIY